MRPRAALAPNVIECAAQAYETRKILDDRGDAVIYEIAAGDMAGFVGRLNHVRALGANIVWTGPGPAQAIARLIEAAGRTGLDLVMDFTGEGPVGCARAAPPRPRHASPQAILTSLSLRIAQGRAPVIRAGEELGLTPGTGMDWERAECALTARQSAAGTVFLGLSLMLAWRKARAEAFAGERRRIDHGDRGLIEMRWRSETVALSLLHNFTASPALFPLPGKWTRFDRVEFVEGEIALPPHGAVWLQGAGGG